MPAPSPAALLDAWEHSFALPVSRRSLALLAAAYPSSSYEALGRLSLGQCDALLLALREQLFGPQLHAVSACPRCREKVEMDFTVNDVRSPAPAKPAPSQLSLESEDHSVTFRLPTPLDLETASQAPDVATARLVLLQRCVLAATRSGIELSSADLPHPVVQQISEAMSEADPQAASEIALVCPACGHRWNVPFDIGAYLWSEIQTWARQLLRDVHVLASAYGWPESAIVALSPARRRAYLDLIQS